tara:strand:+ start:85 stop:585 length:501 start_codon:yes stop_codon:yes gene_type:complete
MSKEQTAYVGDSIKVLVNVIDSTGAHVAATINTSTTRLNGLSTVPTVNTISTGIYEIVFASVTPAPAEGDRLICKVNGDISGTAWSEYAIPVKIIGKSSDVIAAGDIDGYSLEEALKIQLSALAGKISGAGTTTITIRSADDSTDRIVATVDTDGNRSSITLDATG